MPELHGIMPYEDAGPMRPCVWCLLPTDLRFVPEGRPELGLQPLHLTCGMRLIRAYQRMLAGHTLTAGDSTGLSRFAIQARIAIEARSAAPERQA